MIALLIAALSLPGCVLDGAGQARDGAVGVDAASRFDAAVRDGGRDAMPPEDAGPTPDAGPSPDDDAGTTVDGGPLPIDGGPPPVDAGPPPVDAGPSPMDAGPPRRDAGPPDAGSDGGLPTCPELFPTTHLCTPFDDRCELFVMLMGATGNGSCDRFCARSGSECLEASIPNNPAGGKCTPSTAYGCDEETEAHAICVCARVFPPPP